MRWRFIRAVPADQVVREAVVDVGRNLLLFGLAFGILLAAGRIHEDLGLWGRWAFALVGGVFGLRFLLGCLLGLADSVLEGSEGGDLGASGLVLFVTGARALELCLIYWMAFFLFRHAA